MKSRLAVSLICGCVSTSRVRTPVLIAQQAISAFGYITLDSFEDGNTLTLPNQVLRLEATGEYYRWDGAFPKTVPAGSTPDSAGGIGDGAWVAVGAAAFGQSMALLNKSNFC
ncbi:tail fiber/spike domain-containing protein [Citrobacter freundii]|uniref:tail fiber/spike domain-containing protein n=1 Tax=Citrobacter freundii TaxID=546 RepID=UPI00285270ED|nr:hypothetical protein [Citrobacter freundii]MCO4151550.1 hypothetical protein [Citrobacter freundii]MCO4178270.1 hypothetical protein [Citrobacter freundii]